MSAFRSLLWATAGEGCGGAMVLEWRPGDIEQRPLEERGCCQQRDGVQKDVKERGMSSPEMMLIDV